MLVVRKRFRKKIAMANAAFTKREKLLRKNISKNFF